MNKSIKPIIPKELKMYVKPAVYSDLTTTSIGLKSAIASATISERGLYLSTAGSIMNKRKNKKRHEGDDTSFVNEDPKVFA